MQEIERSAADVDQAVAAALIELGVDRADVDVEVLDDGSSGEARVRVIVRDGDADWGAEPSTTDSGSVSPGEEASEVAAELAGPASGGDSAPADVAKGGSDDDEWLDDQADLVADFLDDLFDVMDLPAEVEPVYEDGTMYVDVWTNDEDENLAVLIGRHGAALDALQEVVRGFVHNRTGERCQVVVDVEDYRKRRRAQLVSRARQAAERVQKSGRSERLDPMNAFERKIVHDAVAGMNGVSTGSEGEEPDRRVVISPTS